MGCPVALNRFEGLFEEKWKVLSLFMRHSQALNANVPTVLGKLFPEHHKIIFFIEHL
jgi:hypothetical protein